MHKIVSVQFDELFLELLGFWAGTNFEKLVTNWRVIVLYDLCLLIFLLNHFSGFGFLLGFALISQLRVLNHKCRIRNGFIMLRILVRSTSQLPLEPIAALLVILRLLDRLRAIRGLALLRYLVINLVLLFLLSSIRRRPLEYIKRPAHPVQIAPLVDLADVRIEVDLDQAFAVTAAGGAVSCCLDVASGLLAGEEAGVRRVHFHVLGIVGILIVWVVSDSAVRLTVGAFAIRATGG